MPDDAPKFRTPTPADRKAADELSRGILPPMQTATTAIGPRVVKEALVLRRLGEVYGVPQAALAKQLVEKRGAQQAKREPPMRRELSEFIERQALKRLKQQYRQQFVEELTGLYLYVADLEIMAGMAGQDAVARDREAECGTFQALLLAKEAEAMRVRALVEADDFADEPTKALWRILAPLVPRALLGAGPELYARELAKHPGASRIAVAVLSPTTMWPYLWPEYLVRLRATRIKRERATLLERLREAATDDKLFGVHLRAAVLRLERIEPITKRGATAGL